jgi:mannosyltransferase
MRRKERDGVPSDQRSADEPALPERALGVRRQAGRLVSDGTLHERPARTRLSAGWVVAAITVAGAVLRVSTLDTRSLWLDETTAVRQASWSIPYMLSQMSDNVHPPLFHTLLHFWILAFGRSEVVLRCFPLVWGIAAIPLMYWAARTVYDRRVGFIAAVAVAASPFFIWYSQEVRMYSMMLVFAVVSTGAMWKAMRDDRLRWWAVFSVATAAGLMTQYFYSVLVVGQSAYFLWAFVRDRIRRFGGPDDTRGPLGRRWGLREDFAELAGWAGAVLVASLPMIWWIPQVLAHRDLFRGISHAFNYGWAPPAFGIHFDELILVPVQWVFGFHSTLAMRDLVAMWPLLITLVFVSVGMARHVSDRTSYLVFAGIGGAGIIATLGTWQPILEARYFTAAMVPIMIIAAHLIDDLKPPTKRAVVYALLAVSLVAWLDQSFDPNSIVKWDNRQAMATVASGYEPGDAILLVPNFASSIPEYYLPADIYPFVKRVPYYDALGQPRNSPAQLAEDLSDTIGPARRVWLVASWQDTPRIALDRTLTQRWLTSQGFKLVRDSQLHQIRVTLFQSTRPLGSFFLRGVVR